MLNFDFLFHKAKEIGLEDLDVTYVSSKKMSISCLDSEVENREVAFSESASLRGMYKGIFTSMHVEDLSDANVIKTLTYLKDSSVHWNEQDPNFFYPGDRDYEVLPEDRFDLADHSVRDKLALLEKMNKELANHKDFFHSNSSYEEKSTTVIKKNTKGLNLEQTTNLAYVYGSVVLKNETESVTSYDVGFLKEYDTFDPVSFANKVVAAADSKFAAKTLPSSQYKVILRNNVLADLLNAYSGVFTEDTVLDKKSFLGDKLGEQVFGSNITITDNPFLDAAPYKEIFDDEGVKTRVSEVVKDGKLLLFLENLSTASRVGKTSTGNGVGAGSEIGVDFHTLCLSGGTKDLETLEQEMQDGVVITGIMGLHAGLNFLSGEFNLQAEGYKITGGKREHAVHQIVLSGQIQDVLNNVLELGSDYKYCLCGVYSPSALIKSMNISGN